MATISPQKTMHAAAINRFGGVETLKMQTLPLPEVGADEILIRVESAGVGAWDPWEREGEFAKMFGTRPEFPYVLGSEGAGTVAAVGEGVNRFKEGDRVYAVRPVENPRGGFYAEYAEVKADYAAHVPDKLSTEQAGVVLADAVTGLRGLQDILGLQRGESVMIFGASGGIGHMAVQLARRMGARVFAVASGHDGTSLVNRLGADAVVDGHKDDIAAAARKFAPNGLDAALVTAGGEAAEKALTAVRDGGRIAHPNGVEPVPKARPAVKITAYDGEPDRESIDRLNRLIEAGPFEAHVAQTFSLAQAGEAHRALDRHYVGKLALRPR
jgi:NADPH:quinone reductase-like Zn-dependent oxidoreductase